MDYLNRLTEYDREITLPLLFLRRGRAYFFKRVKK